MIACGAGPQLDSVDTGPYLWLLYEWDGMRISEMLRLDGTRRQDVEDRIYSIDAALDQFDDLVGKSRWEPFHRRQLLATRNFLSQLLSRIPEGHDPPATPICRSDPSVPPSVAMPILATVKDVPDSTGWKLFTSYFSSSGVEPIEGREVCHHFYGVRMGWLESVVPARAPEPSEILPVRGYVRGGMVKEEREVIVLERIDDDVVVHTVWFDPDTLEELGQRRSFATPGVVSHARVGRPVVR